MMYTIDAQCKREEVKHKNPLSLLEAQVIYTIYHSHRVVFYVRSNQIYKNIHKSDLIAWSNCLTSLKDLLFLSYQRVQNKYKGATL